MAVEPLVVLIALTGCEYGDRLGRHCTENVDCAHPIMRYLCCCRCFNYLPLQPLPIQQPLHTSHLITYNLHYSHPLPHVIPQPLPRVITAASNRPILPQARGLALPQASIPYSTAVFWSRNPQLLHRVARMSDTMLDPSIYQGNLAAVKRLIGFRALIKLMSHYLHV